MNLWQRQSGLILDRFVEFHRCKVDDLLVPTFAVSRPLLSFISLPSSFFASSVAISMAWTSGRLSKLWYPEISLFSAIESLSINSYSGIIH